MYKYFRVNISKNESEKSITIIRYNFTAPGTCCIDPHTKTLEFTEVCWHAHTYTQMHKLYKIVRANAADVV